MIFRSFLGQIFAHWKIEATVLSVVTALGLLANEVTSPKVIFAMTVISDWNDMINRQTLINALISGGVGYFVWWARKRVQDKHEIEREKEKRSLEQEISRERNEKDRLAIAASELTSRVSDSEKTLREVWMRLGLMDQMSQPLFEAAKQQLIKVLTHPHAEFKIPDELLAEIVPPGAVLTPELAKVLKERETSKHPDVTAEEKLAASILPKVMLLAEAERNAVGPTIAQIITKPDDKETDDKKL